MSDLEPFKAIIAEMYVALQHSEMILARSANITTNDNGKGPTTSTAVALKKVRAAIAKAEGKTGV